MHKYSLKPQNLTDEQFEIMMDAVYGILENTGGAISHEGALKLLEEAGCTIEKGERTIVKIPRNVVDAAIESVPKELTLYDAEGNEALHITSESNFFGPCLSTSDMIDVYTGEKRKATLKDAFESAAVCDALPNVSWASAIYGVNEKISRMSDVYEVYALLNRCKKPFMFWGQSMDNLKAELDMIKAACGDDAVSAKPHAMCLTCPMDPLVEDDDTVEQLMFAAEIGLPVLHTPGINFGGSAPLHIPTAVALGLADTFMGLVISQLTKPGAPFIVGLYTDCMNFRKATITHHAPEFLLAQALGAEMFHRLNLIYTGNASGDTGSGRMDEVAVFDVAAQQYTGMLAKVNLSLGIGALDNANIGCLPLLIFNDEVIGYMRALTQEIEIDPDTFMLEEIDEVGQGGYFMVHDSTLDNFGDFWDADVFAAYSRAEVEAGAQSTTDALFARARKMIEDEPRFVLSDDKKALVDGILVRTEALYQ